MSCDYFPAPAAARWHHNGMKTTTTTLFVAIALLTGACAKDPAKDATKAKVEEAKPEAKPTDQPPAAGLAHYEINADNSKIVITGSKPTKSHRIDVHGFKGSVGLPEGKPLEAKGTVEIDMTSIRADDPGLTKHLKSKDFFEIETYPTSTFTITEIKEGGDKGASHTVTANLEMRGVKKSVTFPATVAVTPDTVTLTAEFAINRKDWNIVYPGMADDLIRDEVVIALDVKAARAK
jgi:polyisoprenoid-binding protein YceI